MPFDAYIRSIQSNYARGSERTHYPALKNLLDNSAVGIDAAIEEKGNKAGIPDVTVRRRDLLKRYRESISNLILTNYLGFAGMSRVNKG